MGTTVSTYSMYETIRQTLMRQQLQLADAGEEAQTSRYADVGLELGSQTGKAVSVRQALKVLDTEESIAESADNRLDVVSSAMEQLIDLAGDFKDLLVSLGEDDSDLTLSDLAESAAGYLDDIASILNQSYDGDYIFGGVDSDGLPFTNPADDGSSSATAVSDALEAAFPDGVEDATADEISEFLSGAFADLFSDDSWSDSWSNADDETPTMSIAVDSSVEVGVSANDSSIRSLISSLVMIASLGVEDMSDEAADALVDEALSQIGTAIDDLTSRAADIGRSATRTETTLDGITRMQDLLETRLSDLEGVDATEAANTLSAIQNQMEAAYTIASKLYDMSLVDYI